MIPYHIGVIPDGNRRYGNKHGIPLYSAYEKGTQKVEDVIDWSLEKGVKMLTLWGFSTENFSRSQGEQRIFMKLLESRLRKMLDSGEMEKKGIKVNVIGRKNMFPEKICSLLGSVEKKTSKNSSFTFNFALGYGGRQEILDACSKIVRKSRAGSIRLTERLFSSHLYTSGMPDPELIIRTSGEERTSGFLPWQSVYSEFFFIKKLWPEVEKKDFVSALNIFNARKRNFGK